jgi:hypothetical protein
LRVAFRAVITSLDSIALAGQTSEHAVQAMQPEFEYSGFPRKRLAG